MIGSASVKRVTAIAVLGALGVIGGRISALVLVTIVAVVLTGLALWEYDPPGARTPQDARPGIAPAAPAGVEVMDRPGESG